VLASHKLTLIVGTVGDWRDWSLPHVSAEVPSFLGRLNLNEATYFAQLSRDPTMRAEDAYMARVIAAVFDSSSIDVMNFKASTAAADKEALLAGDTGPSTASSGYRLVKAILASEVCTDGALAMMRKEEFEAKAFLTMGMKYACYIKACNDMRTIYNLLPEDERPGKYADVKMFLTKLPEALQLKAGEMRTKMIERLSNGEAPTYTYAALVNKMAIHVVRGGTQAHNFAAHVARAPKLTPTPTPKSGPRSCMNCGSTDHNTTEKDEIYIYIYRSIYIYIQRAHSA
jgi:hypothetical protein